MMDCGDDCGGIKTGEDVIRCLQEHGASARRLYAVYGERIAGLFADALHTLATCKHVEIEMRARPGRVIVYRGLKDLPIPAELELPTCVACDMWLLTRESAPLIDQAMEPVWRARKALGGREP